MELDIQTRDIQELSRRNPLAAVQLQAIILERENAELKKEIEHLRGLLAGKTEYIGDQEALT